MKTGINTENMCVPSEVQRLTQDTGKSGKKLNKKNNTHTPQAYQHATQHLHSD